MFSGHLRFLVKKFRETAFPRSVLDETNHRKAMDTVALSSVIPFVGESSREAGGLGCLHAWFLC